MNGWLVSWLAGYMPLALTHVDSIRSLGSSSHAMHACMNFVSRTIFLFFSLSPSVVSIGRALSRFACLPASHLIEYLHPRDTPVGMAMISGTIVLVRILPALVEFGALP